MHFNSKPGRGGKPLETKWPGLTLEEAGRVSGYGPAGLSLVLPVSSWLCICNGARVLLGSRDQYANTPPQLFTSRCPWANHTHSLGLFPLLGPKG